MPSAKPTALAAAAERMRKLALEAEDGSLIGGEEALIAQLGYSRSTVRQAARLLEREGLLRVKRGPSGGYFAARPDAATIEGAVSAYMQSLRVENVDVMAIAAALWIEAMVRATKAAPERRQQAVQTLRALLDTVKDSATFRQLRNVELQSQGAVFELAESAYVKLIFDINVAFSRRSLDIPSTYEENSEAQRAFVDNFREAKQLELGAIASGNAELAVLACKYSRALWHRMVWQQLGQEGEGPRVGGL